MPKLTEQEITDLHEIARKANNIQLRTQINMHIITMQYIEELESKINAVTSQLDRISTHN